ncbi:hypothetical protein GQ600_9891 [Phytophthora cactorum]|nr:hypothetical protein GQ600_2982 [Phytophthora cactorum]KAF1790658.1 hypothetical protein GQ600_9891 [Phytophthora cactorum]
MTRSLSPSHSLDVTSSNVCSKAKSLCMGSPGKRRTDASNCAWAARRPPLSVSDGLWQTPNAPMARRLACTSSPSQDSTCSAVDTKWKRSEPLPVQSRPRNGDNSAA